MNTHINQLLEKYWEGETTLQEEKQIQSYFSSGNIAPEHEAIAPMFGYIAEQQSLHYDYDLNEVVLQKLEQESTEHTQPHQNKAKAKIINFRRIIISAAALFALVISAKILMDKNTDTSFQNPTYASKNIIVLDGEDDSEEALKVTKEALAFLSRKLSKSGKQVNEGIQNLDKINVMN